MWSLRRVSHLQFIRILTDHYDRIKPHIFDRIYRNNMMNPSVCSA